jgi:hypothetical protein
MRLHGRTILFLVRSHMDSLGPTVFLLAALCSGYEGSAKGKVRYGSCEAFEEEYAVTPLVTPYKIESGSPILFGAAHSATIFP